MRTANRVMAAAIILMATMPLRILLYYAARSELAVYDQIYSTGWQVVSAIDMAASATAFILLLVLYFIVGDSAKNASLKHS